MKTSVLAMAALVLLAGCPLPTDRESGDSGASQGDRFFVEVGVGWSFSCGLVDDGTMGCWGSAISGERPPPNAQTDQMAVGYDGVCWITRGTSEIGCAGMEVVPPIPDGAFSAVAVGRSAACALDEAGELTCFELPVDPDAPVDPEPLGTLPVGPFDALALGAGQGLALRPDGTIAVFGPYSSTPPTGTFVAISAGYREACALSTDGAITCWAEDPSYSYVFDTPSANDFVDVAAGYLHSCALDNEGSVTCWGDNSSGQADPPPGAYVDVAAGGEYSCAVDAAGDVTCWGNATYQGAPPR